MFRKFILNTMAKLFGEKAYKMLGYYDKNNKPHRCSVCGGRSFVYGKRKYKKGHLVSFHCICSSCRSRAAKYNNHTWSIDRSNG